MSSAELDQTSDLHTLYSDHHHWLKSWLRRRLGNDTDAADLAQDTFIRILNNPRRLENMASARSYLQVVADRLCIDLWRRKSVEQAWLDVLTSQPEAVAVSPAFPTALEMSDYQATDLQLANRGSRYTASRAQNTNIIIGDDITFNEQWSALIGANYTTISTRNFNTSGAVTSRYKESALTPSLSLIYKPISTLTTYISYIEGLEQGSIVPNDPANYNNPGKILEPVISKQYETGAKYALASQLMLSSALFRIEKANSYNERTANGKVTVNQDGLQVHQGLELTLSGKLTDDLTVITGGTLMDLSVEKAADASIEGKKPSGASSVLAKIYAEYDIPLLNGLTATAGAYHTGSKYKDSANQQKIDAYTVFDAGLRYKTRIARFPASFNLNISNLTNKDYWATTYSLGIPRTLAFSVKTEF